MADALMENWSETKTALTDGLSGTKKSVMETTLENTKSYLSEAATSGATQAGNFVFEGRNVTSLSSTTSCRL
jgi:hypothetical protein